MNDFSPPPVFATEATILFAVSAGLSTSNDDAPAQSANTYGVSEKKDRRAVIDYLRDN